MMLTLGSSNSVNAISQVFAEKCKENGFALLYTYNYKEILTEKGFPIEREVIVFEICQAEMASAMLTHYPNMSVMMPCRVSVYSDEDKTVIATLDMEPVFEQFDFSDEVKQEALTLFNQIKALMRSLQ